jgi:hypothetical protein
MVLGARVPTEGTLTQLGRFTRSKTPPSSDTSDFKFEYAEDDEHPINEPRRIISSAGRSIGRIVTRSEMFTQSVSLPSSGTPDHSFGYAEDDEHPINEQTRITTRVRKHVGRTVTKPRMFTQSEPLPSSETLDHKSELAEDAEHPISLRTVPIAPLAGHNLVSLAEEDANREGDNADNDVEKSTSPKVSELPRRSCHFQSEARVKISEVLEQHCKMLSSKRKAAERKSSAGATEPVQQVDRGAPVQLFRNKDRTAQDRSNDRRLDKTTEPDRHPTPRMNDLMDRRVPTTPSESTALNQGYRQIKVAPEAVKKTTRKGEQSKFADYFAIGLPRPSRNRSGRDQVKRL